MTGPRFLSAVEYPISNPSAYGEAPGRSDRLIAVLLAHVQYVSKGRPYTRYPEQYMFQSVPTRPERFASAQSVHRLTSSLEGWLGRSHEFSAYEL